MKITEVRRAAVTLCMVAAPLNFAFGLAAPFAFGLAALTFEQAVKFKNTIILWMNMCANTMNQAKPPRSL